MARRSAVELSTLGALLGAPTDGRPGSPAPDPRGRDRDPACRVPRRLRAARAPLLKAAARGSRRLRV